MNELSKLHVIEKNEKTILVNPENGYWVRFSSKRYRKYRENPKNETLFYEYLKQKFQLFEPGGGLKSSLRTVYFAVTGRCNLCCSFCSMNSGPQTSVENDFTLQEIEDVLIPKLRYLNVKKIVITGGEPLIREEISDILKLFSDGFGRSRIILQTNGLLLKKEMVRAVSQYVGTIEISIENIFSDVTLFDQMLGLFETIEKEKLNLSFSFVVDDHSRAYLFQALDLSHLFHASLTIRIVSMVGRANKKSRDDQNLEPVSQLQVYYDVLDYLIEHDYLEENLTGSYLIPLQARASCGGFGKILGIHPNGDTYMCSNFKGSRYQIGNLRSDSIIDVIDSLDQKLGNGSYQKEFLVNQMPVCRDCEVKYFCPGVCPAESAQNQESKERVYAKCLSIYTFQSFAMFYYDRKKGRKENLTALRDYFKSAIEVCMGREKSEYYEGVTNECTVS